MQAARSLRFRVCDVRARLDAQLEWAPGEPPESRELA